MVSDHPIYGRMWTALSVRERDLVLGFIEAARLNGVTVDEFANRANRWFLDDPNKPKNLGAMVELLLVVSRIN
jgi:hypothetical protein